MDFTEQLKLERRRKQCRGNVQRGQLQLPLTVNAANAFTYCRSPEWPMAGVRV